MLDPRVLVDTMTAADTPIADRHQRLAMLGGLLPQPPRLARGTEHSAFLASRALVASGRFPVVDAYYDNLRVMLETGAPIATSVRQDVRVTPADTATLFHRLGSYHALFVAEGAHLSAMPGALRPDAVDTPIVYNVGIAHHSAQYLSFLVAALSGALREGDGLALRSRRVEALMRETWAAWSADFGPLPVPVMRAVPNGIAVEEHRRREPLRRATRERLGIAAGAPVFLAFSRLTRHTKGDQVALVALWRDVLDRAPDATLVLAGAVEERAFVHELERTARAVGAAHRVIVLPDPSDALPNARSALMSAADAFLHLTTGVEEAMPLVVLEAMSHGLAPIASDWSGLCEVVTDGESGWLVETVAGRTPEDVRATVGGSHPILHDGAISRSAACDGRAVVRTVVELATRPELLVRAGQNARARVEAEFTAAHSARHLIAFIDELAARRAARRASSPRRRLLADPDRVLRALATRALDPADEVALGDADKLRSLPPFAAGPWAAAVEHIVARVRDGGPCTVGALLEDASLVGATPDDRAVMRPMAETLLLRLFACNAVELRRRR